MIGEQLVYPTGAAGVTVTTDADAWVLGGFTEIVPINTITKDFDIHFVNIEGISAAGTYELLFYAAEVFLSCERFTVVGTPANRIYIPRNIITPLTVANSQIQAKVMSDNAASEDTCTLSVAYHVY